MPRPSSTWYWDEGSSSAGEYNWCAYDAETSKKIEMYFRAMGPALTRWTNQSRQLLETDVSVWFQTSIREL